MTITKENNNIHLCDSINAKRLEIKDLTNWYV